MKYTPIFDKDGQRFLIANPEYLADDEYTASNIGLGAMFCDGLMLGYKLANSPNVINVPESSHEGTLTGEPATLTNANGEGYNVYLNPTYKELQNAEG